MYIKYNQNPCDKRTIDCTVRALATLLNEDWDAVYVQLCMKGYELCDMPSSKATVNHFLQSMGYKRHIAPDNFPYKYTVEDFANDYPDGSYLLTTDSHVVPVIDGNYIDTWDSGNEIPLFYWTKGD